MDADLVDPSCLASDLVVSVGSEGRDQRGVLQALQMSLACINSGGVGSSRVRLSEKAEGFNPERGDEGVEVDLAMSLGRC